ncbi:MAG: hypothetical protein LWW86_14775 [Micrococcales bacterium]|nr:hypothetical protein [Micrococcales bacterium]
MTARPPLSHRTHAGAAVALLTLLTTACGGGETPAGGSDGASSGATSVTATTAGGPSGGTTAAAYPVVVTRAGGIAGGEDRLTLLAPDGRVQVSGRHAGECTIPATLVRVLGRAFDSAPVGIPPASPSGADQLVVTLSREGRRVLLWQTSLSDAEQAQVSALLDDSQRPPQERTVCTQQRP